MALGGMMGGGRMPARQSGFGRSPLPGSSLPPGFLFAPTPKMDINPFRRLNPLERMRAAIGREWTGGGGRVPNMARAPRVQGFRAPPRMDWEGLQDPRTMPVTPHITDPNYPPSWTDARFSARGRGFGGSQDVPTAPTAPPATNDNKRIRLVPISARSAFIDRVIGVESGGKDTAKNPKSSALGLGQFLTSTWNELRMAHPELGLTAGGRTDPVQARKGLEAFTADNESYLRKSGIPITPGSLYAAHFLGRAGAVKAFNQPDTTSLSAVVGPDVIRANSFLSGMTVGTFKKWAERKMRGARPAGKSLGRTMEEGEAVDWGSLAPPGWTPPSKESVVAAEVRPPQTPQAQMAEEIFQSGDTTPLQSMTYAEKLNILREFMRLGGFDEDVV